MRYTLHITDICQFLIPSINFLRLHECGIKWLLESKITALHCKN